MVAGKEEDRMEQTVQVGLGERSYPIIIGTEVMEQIGTDLGARNLAKRYCVISDDRVAGLYGDRLLQLLRQ
jgi:3-dehydroquinate synthase